MLGGGSARLGSVVRKPSNFNNYAVVQVLRRHRTHVNISLYHQAHKKLMQTVRSRSLANSITDIGAHPASTYCTLAVNPATTPRIAILATWAFTVNAANCISKGRAAAAACLIERRRSAAGDVASTTGKCPHDT